MSEKLTVSLVQTSIYWENPSLNRELLLEKINAISIATDLIVLPEMFTTGFTMHPEKILPSEGEKTVAWMQKIASSKKVAITGSLAFYENGTYYNRLFFVAPNAEIVFYDKRHTFTLAGESDAYRAGSTKIMINYKGFTICPLICYDLRFPVWARNTENYDVLLYVANWPKPRINAWDILLQARAIENMAYCIGVNRVGTDDLGHEYPSHSAVYDVLGNELVFSKKEEIKTISLYKEHIETTRNKLKFLEDKDDFSLTI
ncbi:nitrilase family protein [Cellulophaga sp. Hel_I_12]|uniref:nitrilase family protein n=1 Tax=Cellulophaga sp. Hel_I_12 TaxID=1249972 RepID=UPI000647DB25|nr:nitrilase family protein [Cellulophaga sp. Hel_I_12]